MRTSQRSDALCGCDAQLTWLFDNDGIPKNWRKLNGFGVNTFKLINADGEEHLCKFHCLPVGGESCALVSLNLFEFEKRGDGSSKLQSLQQAVWRHVLSLLKLTPSFL